VLFAAGVVTAEQRGSVSRVLLGFCDGGVGDLGHPDQGEQDEGGGGGEDGA